MNKSQQRVTNFLFTSKYLGKTNKCNAAQLGMNVFFLSKRLKISSSFSIKGWLTYWFLNAMRHNGANSMTPPQYMRCF